MKTILFYDFETNGLPLFKEPSEHPGQPYFTQLAAELCIEETGQRLAGFDMLIRPEGWTIPEDLQALTGITMEKADSFGVPANVALDSLLELWSNADLRAGHNESFDARIARIAIMRSAYWSGEAMETSMGEVSFADYWKAAPAFCTKTSSTKIINLPPSEKMLLKNMKGPKSPNLGEAYYHFTGKVLDGAHDAQVDIMACKAVYFGIKKHLAAV
ncbi:MAG: 3'-5' exonuclease [Pseudomonadota bacterium]